PNPRLCIFKQYPTNSFSSSAVSNVGEPGHFGAPLAIASCSVWPATPNFKAT
ncbi:14278_t:CDS:1, partial [Dentiscutata heterogama]